MKSQVILHLLCDVIFLVKIINSCCRPLNLVEAKISCLAGIVTDQFNLSLPTCSRTGLLKSSFIRKLVNGCVFQK